MLPIRDDNPTEIFPLFTLLIAAACVVVWVLLQGAGTSASALVGSVCELGRLVDVPTPTIDAVLALVRLKVERPDGRRSVTVCAAGSAAASC